VDTKTYRTNQISEIPKSLGIYAWFLAYDYNTDHNDYHDVFKSSIITSTVEGIFKDVYTGPIKQQAFSFDENIVFSSFLNEVISLFCPPVYIGISSNLRNRLSTHRDELNSLLYSEEAFKYNENAKIDSDGESYNFAIRLARVLRSVDSIGLRNLRIKVIEAGEGMKRDEVFAIEKYLNRTYTPIYGRK